MNDILICVFKEFDERNSRSYQEITLRRKDNSINIFEEFLKLNENQLICNGKKIVIFNISKIP